MAQAYLRTAEEKDLCLIWGANLRAEPTGRSSSLGRYHEAPARVLGETEDGWLHVFVPEGDLSWALDQPGTFGYLHRDRIRLWLGAATYDE